MEANGERGGGDAENAGGFLVCEPFPIDQCQDFLVLDSEGAEGEAKVVKLVRILAGFGGAADSRRRLQVTEERSLAPLAAVLVPKDPSGHGKKPGKRLRARRNSVDLLPRDRERLGDDVLGRLLLTEAPESIGEDSSAVLLEEGAKTRLWRGTWRVSVGTAWGERSHTYTMPGSRPIITGTVACPMTDDATWVDEVAARTAPGRTTSGRAEGVWLVQILPSLPCEEKGQEIEPLPLNDSDFNLRHRHPAGRANPREPGVAWPRCRPQVVVAPLLCRERERCCKTRYIRLAELLTPPHRRLLHREREGCFKSAGFEDLLNCAFCCRRSGLRRGLKDSETLRLAQSEEKTCPRGRSRGSCLHFAARYSEDTGDKDQESEGDKQQPPEKPSYDSIHG